MTLSQALDAARTAGIDLWLDRPEILYRGPKGASTPELRQALMAHKPALWRFLASGQLFPQETPDETGDKSSLRVGGMCPRCREEGKIGHLYAYSDGRLACLECKKRGLT